MRINRRAAGQLFLRAVLCSFLLSGLWAAPSEGQQTPKQAGVASPNSAPTTAVPLHGAVNLDGQWKFHTGDDPLWADPALDDTTWPAVNLSQTLVEQGFDTYSGYGWYRLKLQPEQVAAISKMASSQELALLVTGNSAGQVDVYVNGLEAGHTRGMTDAPAEYLSPPVVAPLNPASSGPTVIAVRTWAGPTITISRGLLQRVDVGAANEMGLRQSMAVGRQWNENVIAGSVVTFLFICVAVLGGFLYLAQRNHQEYLWLSLMCLAVAATGSADAAYGLGKVSLGAYRVLTVFSNHLFMAVTLEFILHFTATKSRRFVRAVQIAVIVLPLLYFVHLPQLYQVLSIVAEVLFCGLVTVLLYYAWRGGRKEAGVMVVPFFLAAMADSADSVLSYAAFKHWLPDTFASHKFHFGPVVFGIGTVAYTVFLLSLIAVILYRFIHISQDEQKSAAEISAAKSVQALLIPTQLPSNKNFMLESAYLPVHGVGGDFFQVLPLKDDSLLIVVGDVSGKGLQAAMNSSTLVGALRNELSHDPATVLKHLNHVLIGAVASPGTAVKELDCAPCYATCLCARVYPDGTTSIANAGHLSPYRDGREVAVMPSLPLGVIAEAEYEATTFQLNRGDRLVFLSDGVVEAQNDQGELFGFERTQQVSNESARYIAQTAKHFGQTDDITVLSLYLASRTAQAQREELAYR
ncbi:MAG: SpoIIE family protein phosphatase [Acidobacteria bacterium]|nr:SpoIIE family protein phosphatase [Acidobacteriota bacterium]